MKTKSLKSLKLVWGGVNYNTEQEIAISLTGVTREDINNAEDFTFTVYDKHTTVEGLETIKTLSIKEGAGDPIELKVVRSVEHGNKTYRVNIKDECDANGINGNDITITFAVKNGFAHNEDLIVYFHEDTWRKGNWNGASSGNWEYNYESDPLGYLGPLDPNLDHRIYRLQNISEVEIEKTRDAGDTFTYYTTDHATQPVIVNNRFLNGIYASALFSDMTEPFVRPGSSL